MSAGWRGEALPEWMRRPLEELLGEDLVDLRFHDGVFARGLCRVLGAGAVTFGRRIYVSSPGRRRLTAGGRFALSLAAHEAVHVLQFRRDGFFPMLARYLGEYLRGRLRGLSHDQAYRQISYEKEAFAVEAAVLRPAGTSPAHKVDR